MKLALHLDGRAVRGSERQALMIASGLLRRGHIVVASCRGEGPVREALEAAGVHTTAIRPRGDVDIVSTLRFAAWLRREGPDAVLLTSWKRVPVAGWAARLAGVPKVAMRMGGIHRIRPGLGGRLRRMAFGRWYDLIIANSEGARSVLRADLPDFPESAIPVIHNAVEPPVAEAADIRAERGVPAGAVLLLAVGGLEPLKGNDLLARALSQLDDDVHVLVAGGGTPEQRADVERAVRGAGVAERFHLLGVRRDVPALLSAADVFVHPSRHDSLPNALLEAMAAGLPVVCTEIGGAGEALAARDGRGPAGWIVPRDDAGALAGSLRTVVRAVRTGARAAAARAEEARWRAEHWFGPDGMVEAYEAVLG